jgi:hypothetical protein
LIHSHINLHMDGDGILGRDGTGITRSDMDPVSWDHTCNLYQRVRHRPVS